MTTERRKDSGYLSDEQGSKSMGRALLVACLVFLAPLIVVDAGSSAFDVPDPAWAILGGVFTGLLAWVAGPRVTQHIGAAISGVAQAKRSVPFGGPGIWSAAAPGEILTKDDLEPPTGQGRPEDDE